MSIPMDDDSYEYLKGKIEAATNEDRYRSTKAQIVDYFQQEYPNTWQNSLTKWIASHSSGIESLSTMKEASIRRRFNPSRLNSPENKNAAQYAALGRQLPPVRVPKKIEGKSASVHFVGTITYSGVPYDKDFTCTLSPAQLADMIENNSLDPVFQAYGIQTWELIEETEISSLSIDIS